MVTAFDSSKKLSTGRSTLGPTLSHGQELWVVTEEMSWAFPQRQAEEFRARPPGRRPWEDPGPCLWAGEARGSSQKSWMK